jgi:hypothetical protein
MCRGAGRDPLYVDVMVRRYEAGSGEPAVLIETNELFDVVAARRSTKAEPIQVWIQKPDLGQYKVPLGPAVAAPVEMVDLQSIICRPSIASSAT